MNEITLNQLQLGESCYIKEIRLIERERRRLQELGFVKNSLVKCVLKSPFKEPVAYFVKGTMIVIREEMSKNIFVERL